MGVIAFGTTVPRYSNRNPGGAISALTRVHSPSKTGVNALMDALWRNPGINIGVRVGSMIGRLNHVAIAVRDLAKASAVYRDMLGAQVSAPEPQPAHGVTTVFITLPNTKIELIAPLGEDSPIA